MCYALKTRYTRYTVYGQRFKVILPGQLTMPDVANQRVLKRREFGLENIPSMFLPSRQNWSLWQGPETPGRSLKV